MSPVNEILLGDCREVLRRLEASSIAACITDPPYNYEFIGHKWDHTEISRRLDRVQNGTTLVKNIPYGSGLAGGVRNERWYQRVRENIQDYQDWCFDWSQELFRVCKPGAMVAAFNSTRTFAHVQIALERAGFYARDCVVYRRNSGIPKGLNVASKMRQLGHPDAESWKEWHSCLRNEWEAIVIVQKPLSTNYVETLLSHGVGLMKTIAPDGSFRSNIIEGICRENKNYASDFHCTVKPLSLMKLLIEMLVPPSPQNVVLDPFAGSGTTLVAAKELGFSFLGIEIVEEYCELARERIATASQTGTNARRSQFAPGKSEAHSLFEEESF